MRSNKGDVRKEIGVIFCPNNALPLIAYSVRSCVAPAFGGGLRGHILKDLETFAGVAPHESSRPTSKIRTASGLPSFVAPGNMDKTLFVGDRISFLAWRIPVIASWKDIINYQRTAQIAKAAESFREEQEAERRRSPADVFISYSSRDRQKALLLCTKLEEAGVAYFLDEKEIKPGDELPSTRISDCTERGTHNTYFLVMAA